MYNLRLELGPFNRSGTEEGRHCPTLSQGTGRLETLAARGGGGAWVGVGGAAEGR